MRRQDIAVATSNRRKLASALGLASLALVVANAGGRASQARASSLRLDSMAGLQMVNTKAEIVTYRGRKALHLAPPQNREPDRESMLALVDSTDFKDGTIEVDRKSVV